MSTITDFFLNNGTDYKGRSLLDMLNMTDHEFEASHDVIQFLFPLHEKSYHSLTAPIMMAEDVAILSESVDAQKRLLDALFRFEDFLGIDSLSETFDQKKVIWWCHAGNHNLLRITRIIRCLRLFGLEKWAKKFYNTIVKVSQGKGLSEVTHGFWKRALEEPVLESMTQEFLKQRRIEL